MVDAPACDEEKLAEWVLYIAVRCEGMRYFGLTKLHKILFFSDFRSYRERHEAITGARYIKAPYGPVAEELPRVLASLQEQRSALVRDNLIAGKKAQKRVIALKAPDLGKFLAVQVAIVDAVIDDLSGLTAEEVSNLSHEFAGWKVAEPGEVIPYSTALIMDPEDPDPLSSSDLAHIRLSRSSD